MEGPTALKKPISKQLPTKVPCRAKPAGLLWQQLQKERWPTGAPTWALGLLSSAGGRGSPSTPRRRFRMPMLFWTQKNLS